MIPIYEAIEFKGLMQGGSTRPWQVMVLENGVPESYVVKLYDEVNNEQNCTVFKECICSRLAREFDLETPDAALIDFTPAFIANLPDPFRNVLRQKDPRLKFATKLVRSPYQNYSPALSEAFLKGFDIGTIYAFDNLILNVDRRVEKPNLLFKDGRVVLIDHELTLTTTQNAEKALIANVPWSHYYQNHLFFRNLKYMNDQEREGCFDGFSYYLRDLIDFSFLDLIADQLVECGHPAEAYIPIKRYLCKAQENESIFVQLLESTLQ